jgi:hypothetical protein
MKNVGLVKALGKAMVRLYYRSVESSVKALLRLY